ncbi:TPA: hypothetical protein N0F65_001823 [Lagenidium giganteum]|uniref:Uncharacterized protein n=1 Tax=Lagenidium giganteum TaxID=4803 RepID=A0AAV2Z1P6_9STRA|nr:TPA: hypothetical protein N0F65_001823 [Lagenidium giganteum]
MIIDLASVSKLSSLDTIEGDDITRELLRQTRNKLDRIMASSVSNQSSPVSTGQPRSNARNDASPSTNDDGSWDGRPLTNYHLQQMGLVKEKVNIYAPLEEQKRQIRQVLAQQYQQPTKQHGHNVLPSHQTLAAKRRLDSDASTTDSDYIPSESGMDTGSTALSDDTEDSTTNNSTASDSDSESTQLVRSHVMFDSWFVWLPVYLLSFCVLVLALLLAVDTADERYHFCQLTPDTAVSLSSTSEGTRVPVV